MNFITGTSGLVGSHVLVELLKRKQKIRALIRNRNSIKKIQKVVRWYDADLLEEFGKVEWIEGDILNYASLAEAINEHNTVFHCAGMVSFHYSDKKKLHNINVNGTSNIVNVCLEKNAILCQVSSVAATESEKEDEEINEESWWKGKKEKSVYAVSKYLAEMEVWRGISEGLRALIVNPTVILGPGDFSRSSGKIVTSISNGLKYYPNGNTGYVDARDVAEMLIVLAEKEVFGERFILNGITLDYRSVFEHIVAHLNIKANFKEVSYRKAMLAATMAQLWARITFSKASITKDSIKPGFRTNLYNGEKITQVLETSYRHFNDTVKNACTYYLETHS
jgi:dihydroflavonol-4-reductase